MSVPWPITPQYAIRQSQIDEHRWYSFPLHSGGHVIIARSRDGIDIGADVQAFLTSERGPEKLLMGVVTRTAEPSSDRADPLIEFSLSDHSRRVIAIAQGGTARLLDTD